MKVTPKKKRARWKSPHPISPNRSSPAWEWENVASETGGRHEVPSPYDWNSPSALHFSVFQTPSPLRTPYDDIENDMYENGVGVLEDSDTNILNYEPNLAQVNVIISFTTSAVSRHQITFDTCVLFLGVGHGQMEPLRSSSCERARKGE